MKLIVIGNGFDLAHGIKSEYSDFGEFLLKYEPDFYNNLMYAFNNDQSIWGAFEDNLPLCANVIENNGLNMANERLGELDYDPMSDEGMGYWLKEQYNFIRQLPVILRKWVETIDCRKAKIYKEQFFKKEDLVLTFNYTNVVENLYNVSSAQVCHIHGNVKNENEILTMGHGNTQCMDYVKKELLKAQEAYAECAKSVYRCELEYLTKCYKNTDNIIEKNSTFFDRIKQCDEAHIIGCSISNADIPYIKKIIELGVQKLFIYYHTLEANNRLEKAMKTLNTDSDIYEFVSTETIKIQ